MQVDERSGAAGVEAAAISAVKQLQASGVNVAKDLQVRTPLRLCSAAMLFESAVSAWWRRGSGHHLLHEGEGDQHMWDISPAVRVLQALRYSDANSARPERRCCRP